MSHNQTLSPGELIDGKYRVTSLLRMFKSGNWYRVTDGSGRNLMLEFINLASMPPGAFDDSGELLQTILLRSLNHPQVPAFQDLGETVLGNERFAYLVFDFVPGETVREKVAREGAMSAFKISPLMCELLDVVGYLHSRPEPLIHNGISLDSIVIDYSGNKETPRLG
jgi:transitional endoplasmic reticulum ATPase